MAQNLAMPLNTCTVTCCYKTEAPNYYLQGAGPVHYATDFIGNSNTAKAREFFASGDGIVLGTNSTPGQTVGRWVIVKYYNVSGFGDLIVRYFHLESVYVSAGQLVNLDIKIGQYGDSGLYVTPEHYHLHVEVDTDLSAWNYTPTISAASGDLKAGTRDQTDAYGNLTGSRESYTRNPLNVFKRKLSAPENQTCAISYDANYRTRTSGTGSFN